MVREVFQVPADNNEPDANNVASQQWQGQEVTRAGNGPQTTYQQRPGFANDQSPYPPVVYQPRPGEWQNPVQQGTPQQGPWQNPQNPGGDQPLPPGSRPGYGPSGTLPTDNGGTVYYPPTYPQQGPYWPQQPGQPQQPGYQPQQPGYQPQQPGYQPQQPGYQPQQPGYQPQQPTDTGSGSNDNKGGGFGSFTGSLLDYAGMGTGSWFAHKNFQRSLLDPSKPWSRQFGDLEPATKVLEPRLDKFETASENYLDLLKQDAARHRTALEDLARAKGLQPEDAFKPGFETKLAGDELSTFNRYNAYTKEMQSIEGYVSKLNEGIGSLREVPPTSTIDPKFLEGEGALRLAATRYGKEAEALGTDMKSVLVKQEGAVKEAGWKNMATLGGAMAGNFLVDHMWFKGDTPSLRTDIADTLIPFIALLPRGNMAMKIGSMVLLHTIFKGLDHEHQNDS